MPDAGLPVEKKDVSRLKGTLKKAFAKKAPWWIKVLRCTALALALYGGMEFVVLPSLPGRHLTTAEATELKTIFKDAVDYSKPRIHSSRAMDFYTSPLAGLTDTLVYGHTRGNVIVTNGDAAERDYMAKGVNDFNKEMFVHESVHVWQHQNAPLALKWAMIRQSVKRQGGIDGFYSYKLEPGKDLLDFNIEQQAAIITDYYMRIKKGEDPNDCLNDTDRATRRELYESTLQQFEKNPSYIRNYAHKLH